MMDNKLTYNIKYTDLPDVLPVFPLEGVVLLPHGQLPLNIFEPRYMSMVNDALQADRLIGIVQPQTENSIKSGPLPLQKTGCVGKIIEFKEHADNRYIITLQGLWRFHVAEELAPKNNYRRIRPLWHNFAGDVAIPDTLDIDREKLRDLMKAYLDRHNMFLDCEKIDKTSDVRLITALSMICPLDPIDKQALLEAPYSKTRARMFMAILEMAAYGKENHVLH